MNVAENSSEEISAVSYVHMNKSR